MKLRRVLIAAATTALVAAGLALPGTVSAGSPNNLIVTAGGGPVTYSATLGPGWPDPNGPPAPPASCSDNAGGVTPCDYEHITLGSDTGGVQVTFTYTPSDPAGQNCLDVAIEDATSTVIAHQSCVGTGAVLSASGLTPGGHYTIEVDANGTDVASLTQQQFSARIVGVAGGGSGGGSSPPPTSNITFSHEITLDPQRADGEPDLAITSDGNSMYSSAPWGFSTTVSFAWKSLDAGVQWYNLHGGGNSATVACPTPNVDLRPNCSRGGGDTEIQLSSPETTGGPQTVQFEDLNGLDTISCAYSTNGGDTFTDIATPTDPTSHNPIPGSACNESSTGNVNPAICNPTTTLCLTDTTAPGTDRQWVAVCPHTAPCASLSTPTASTTADKLYMVYDTGETPPGGDASIYSTDGGHNWQLGCSSNAVTTLSTTSCVGGSTAVGTRPGPVVINVNDGTLYEFMGTNNNGAEVNISCDGGQTWAHQEITHGQAGSTTNDFVVGAIDTSGGLYAAWAVANGSSPWQVFYSHSTDPNGTSGVGNCTHNVQGGSWSTPEALNGATGTAAPTIRDAVMPWITVGSPGRVDVAYYGASPTGAVDPSSTPQLWYLYMAQTLMGQNATHNWSTVQASETPMHNNSICFNGIGCTGSGDRNLLDFFQVKTDPSGRAVIVFTDDNNTQAGAPQAGFPGAGLISLVQQATGPGLFSAVNGGYVTPLAASGLGQSLDLRNEVTDPVNDGQLQPGAGSGHNLPQPGSERASLDITDLKVLSKNSSTLEFLITLKSLAGGPASAVVGNHTGAIWLITWHQNNDWWFASANQGNTGFTCIAGKPTSIFTSGGPKAVQYTTSMSASNVPCTPNNGANTIEIDVPLSNIGNPSNGSVLYGLTAYTGDTGLSSVIDNTPMGFFDNADQTAPIDAVIGQNPETVPEAFATPLIVSLGATAVVAGGLVRLRKRRRLH
jgi:hypothetical protein